MWHRGGGAGLTIDKELLLNGKADLLSSVAELIDDVLEVDGEGGEEPQEDVVVHPPTAGKSRGSDVESVVVIEGVAPQHQQDEVTSASVMSNGDVEDDRDQGSNVLDTDSPDVEGGDDGGLERVIGIEEEGAIS
jgi:hypothetical protein